MVTDAGSVLSPSHFALAPVVVAEALLLLTVTFYVLRRAAGLSRTEFDAPDRLLDVLIASSVLLLVSPVLCLVAIAIKLDDGGRLFTRPARCSRRCGKDGKQFTVWKFRTMHEGPHEEHCKSFDFQPLATDPRLTRVGRFLKSSGLDELPLLLNVLAGDMSIFGPKPLTPDEFGDKTAQFPARSRVRPGIMSRWDILRYHVDLRHRRVEKIIDLKAWLTTEEQYVNGMSLRINLGILVSYCPRLLARLTLPVVEEVRNSSTRDTAKPPSGVGAPA